MLVVTNHKQHHNEETDWERKDNYQILIYILFNFQEELHYSFLYIENKWMSE